ncbi:SGNH/GDSL hydrolase family protein [Microbacterium hominis]|uniref:SGNH/GDSL hydrolase family protein n=1 Tax=Microbacterium hominis TaxID=162426 RepID=A0A7D4QB39_9MICO|nr:SGNH/GDSL hydrolase family protein [Microbacterium hominis]QKJ18157.1 SGNH/GDSL hydrolase family protein [Microbacterium hominis]
MRRRIVALMAALGLAISVSVAAAPAATAVSNTGASYVAFGDSEAAGTGNLFYVERGTCLRSRISYPLILGGTSYACASVTTDGTIAQVHAAAAAGKLGGNTKLVTVTAGINNLPWQQTLLTCAQAGPEVCQQAVAALAPQFATVAPGVAGIVATVRGYAPNAKILVTGYPQLFGDVTTSCRVGFLNGSAITVPAATTALANAAVDTLNQTIVGGLSIVGDPNTVYVDLAARFDTHGLCDTRTPWVNGVIGLPVLSDGSLHVNAIGQFAIAATVRSMR